VLLLPLEEEAERLGACPAVAVAITLSPFQPRVTPPGPASARVQADQAVAKARRDAI
jgi:hypothetical protein